MVKQNILIKTNLFGFALYATQSPQSLGYTFSKNMYAVCKLNTQGPVLFKEKKSKEVFNRVLQDRGVKIDMCVPIVCMRLGTHMEYKQYKVTLILRELGIDIKEIRSPDGEIEIRSPDGEIFIKDKLCNLDNNDFNIKACLKIKDILLEKPNLNRIVFKDRTIPFVLSFLDDVWSVDFPGLKFESPSGKSITYLGDSAVLDDLTNPQKLIVLECWIALRKLSCEDVDVEFCNPANPVYVPDSIKIRFKSCNHEFVFFNMQGKLYFNIQRSEYLRYLKMELMQILIGKDVCIYGSGKKYVKRSDGDEWRAGSDRIVSFLLEKEAVQNAEARTERGFLVLVQDLNIELASLFVFTGLILCFNAVCAYYKVESTLAMGLKVISACLVLIYWANFVIMLHNRRTYI